MATRFVVVVIAVAFVATACGSSQHAAVTNYLNLVNATERKLEVPLEAVTTANRAFAAHQSTPQVKAQLARAEVTLRQARKNIATIAAPSAARHLRALLLELLTREVDLTQELRELSTFVPRFDAALQPLAAADTSLKHELGATAKGAAASKALDATKASALESYASIVDAAIVRLRALHPPAVWRPTYTSQLAALVELRDSGTALAAAIAGAHAPAVPALLRRFDAAAVADQSLAVQRRQVAAVKTYNRQVASLGTIVRKIERERNRLQSATS